MKTSLLASLFIAATTLTTACGASLHATTINAAPHPMTPRSIESVEMYTSGPPARPHVDVALFEVEEASSFSTAGTPEMINKLRERGAQMGCDAVVLGSSSSRDPGMNDAETFLNDKPKGRKGFMATCIAYTL